MEILQTVCCAGALCVNPDNGLRWRMCWHGGGAWSFEGRERKAELQRYMEEMKMMWDEED